MTSHEPGARTFVPSRNGRDLIDEFLVGNVLESALGASKRLVFVDGLERSSSKLGGAAAEGPSVRLQTPQMPPEAVAKGLMCGPADDP